MRILENLGNPFTVFSFKPEFLFGSSNLIFDTLKIIDVEKISNFFSVRNIVASKDSEKINKMSKHTPYYRSKKINRVLKCHIFELKHLYSDATNSRLTFNAFVGLTLNKLPPLLPKFSHFLTEIDLKEVERNQVFAINSNFSIPIYLIIKPVIFQFLYP